jgi:hypothetical protein
MVYDGAMDDDFSPSLLVLGFLAIIVLVIGAGWGIHACNIAENATLGAADQEVQRRNFEHSEAYRAGLRRDFEELMMAYAHANSDDERAVILATLRHRVEAAPPEAVPQDVKQFLSSHTK